MKYLRAAIIAFAVFAGTSSLVAAQDCVPHIIAAERYYNMPTGLLMAISLVESQHSGRPYPWALNVDGDAIFASTRAESIKLLRQAIRHVGYSVAVGCMQIHLRYHRAAFARIEDALEPGTNVWYGAAYLASLHDETRSWTTAVARYHASSSNKLASYTYVCLAWSKLVTLGGQADPRGAAYCKAAKRKR